MRLMSINMNIWTVLNKKSHTLNFNGWQMAVLFIFFFSIFELRLPRGLFTQCCLDSPWLTFAVQMPRLISMLNKWNMFLWHKHSSGRCAQITESANVIYCIFAIGNVVHQGEWWISCDWCRINLNFQKAWKSLVKRGGLEGWRFINKFI